MYHIGTEADVDLVEAMCDSDDSPTIDGIDVTTTMTILSEAGWDMSKWKTEHHFVSWLRLCPDNKISGDKIIGKGRLPTNHRVTNALRMAASTLRLSNTYLGAQFRRLRTKLGAPVAIKAMAAKLARLVYRMLRYGMSFIDRGAEFYDAQHRKLQINYLKRKAANLGLQIIQAPGLKHSNFGCFRFASHQTPFRAQRWIVNSPGRQKDEGNGG